MKKLELPYRTLDDKIVNDGLTAVSHLDDTPSSKGLYIVVGGVAVQSYLPTRCRRPTADLDLAIGRPLTYSEFKEFAAPVVEYMQDNGYSCSTRKKARAFGVLVKEEDGIASLLIEFARHNGASFSNFESILTREFENSRKKRVEEGDDFYSVASPEDIAVPKLVRVVNSFKRSPEFAKQLARFSGSLSDEDIARLLNYIGQRRENAAYSLGDVQLAEELRVCSDLYDVRLLSEIVGFNEHYLREASQDWDSLREPSPEKEKVVKALLSINI